MQCCKTETLRFRDRRNGTKSLFLFSIPLISYQKKEKRCSLLFPQASVAQKVRVCCFPFCMRRGLSRQTICPSTALGFPKRANSPSISPPKPSTQVCFSCTLKTIRPWRPHDFSLTGKMVGGMVSIPTENVPSWRVRPFIYPFS